MAYHARIKTEDMSMDGEEEDSDNEDSNQMQTDECLQQEFPTRIYIVNEHSYARETVDKDGRSRPVHVVIKNLPFTVSLALKDPVEEPGAGGSAGGADSSRVNFQQMAIDACLLYDTADGAEKVVETVKDKPMYFKRRKDKKRPSCVNVECRLNVLTSQHEKSFFRVKVRGLHPLSGQEFFPPLYAISGPIKVISKSEQVKKPEQKRTGNHLLAAKIAEIEKRQQEQEHLIRTLLAQTKRARTGPSPFSPPVACRPGSQHRQGTAVSHSEKGGGADDGGAAYRAAMQAYQSQVPSAFDGMEMVPYSPDAFSNAATIQGHTSAFGQGIFGVNHRLLPQAAEAFHGGSGGGSSGGLEAGNDGVQQQTNPLSPFPMDDMTMFTMDTSVAGSMGGMGMAEMAGLVGMSGSDGALSGSTSGGSRKRKLGEEKKKGTEFTEAAEEFIRLFLSLDMGERVMRTRQFTRERGVDSVAFEDFTDNLGDRCQEEEKRKKGCLCNACPFKAELRKLDSIYGEMMTLPPLPSSPSSPSSSSTHMDGPDSPPPDQRLMSYADPFGQDGHSVW